MREKLNKSFGFKKPKNLEIPTMLLRLGEDTLEVVDLS